MKFSLPSLIQFYAVAALIYISLGDVFLPHPYNLNSKELQNNINQYLIGFFPKQELNYIPNNYRSADTLETLDTFKQAKPGSENSPF